MAQSPSFQQLLSRLQRGGAEAGAEAAKVIVERFAARLAALAAKKMGEGLKRRVDPEDVRQSVFATFFRQLEAGRVELRDWESLWGLLAQITVWRICRYVEHHNAERRSLDREESGRDTLAVVDREPTPEQHLMVLETFEELCKGFDEKQRLMVQRHLEGATRNEVASELNLSLATVDRCLRRVRERACKVLAREGGGEVD